MAYLFSYSTLIFRSGVSFLVKLGLDSTCYRYSSRVLKIFKTATADAGGDSANGASTSSSDIIRDDIDMGDLFAEISDVLSMWYLLISIHLRSSIAQSESNELIMKSVMDVNESFNKVLSQVRIAAGSQLNQRESSGSKNVNLKSLLKSHYEKMKTISNQYSESVSTTENDDAFDPLIDFAKELPLLINLIIHNRKTDKQEKTIYNTSVQHLIKGLSQTLPTDLFNKYVKDVIESSSPTSEHSRFYLSQIDSSTLSNLSQRRIVVVVGYGRIGKAIVNELILQDRFDIIVITPANAQMKLNTSYSIPGVMKTIIIDTMHENGAQAANGDSNGYIQYIDDKKGNCSVKLSDYSNAFESVFCVISALHHGL